MAIAATEEELVYGAGTGIPVPAFSVPWGAVYAANNLGEVLEPNLPLFGRTTNPFRLFSFVTADTRYWQCSSAQFELVAPIVSLEAMNLAYAATQGNRSDVIRHLEKLAIAPEDPIAIHGGYSRKLFSDEQSDIFPPEPGTPDQKGPGYRLFFGYIDTVKIKLTSKGVKLIIQARDPMRFLIDNKFTGQLFGDAITVKGSIGYRYTSAAGSATNDPNEQDVTLADVQSAVRDVSINPATANVDETDYLLTVDGIKDANGKPNNAAVQLTKHKILAWLIMAGSNGLARPAPFILPRQPEVDGPGFELSTRPISVPNLGSAPAAEQAYTLINQVPLQAIKHYATMEAEPREMWADKITGTICWRHRFTRRIANPWAFSFLVDAKDAQGNLITRPNVLSAEMDWSSVSAITEIVIINPAATNNQSGAAQQASGAFLVSGRLPDNRFFPDLISTAFPGLTNMPRRTRFVFDDSLNQLDNGNVGVDFARALLLHWGRDLRAGTINTIGCPQIQVGDAIRLYNHGFFQQDLMRVEAITTSFTASGPNKGFRSSLAVAQADEQRRYTISSAEAKMGTSPTEGSRMFFGDLNTERPAASVGYNQAGVDFGTRPENPI